jgi:hypothetical protein|tara:strand:+ start:127 stop:393 length:267 start_codon:yes stop_codon:yes gene_type:complete
MKRKLDKEHLELIEKLRENFAKNANILGNISIEQHLLANQQTELAKEKDNYLREFTQLQNQEKDLLSKLKDRYGDGQINIDEGTFIPS